jgi:hypothetical protein
LSKIISIIGIVLLASSFLFFYLSSSSDYDHVTTYNYVIDLDAHPFFDPITNISMRATGYGWSILLEPQDYLTVSMENLPVNRTVDLMFQEFGWTMGELRPISRSPTGFHFSAPPKTVL